MSSQYLDGSMVPRAVKRHVDHRSEPRAAADPDTAVVHFRGRDHRVALINISNSGAMARFSLIPHIGETISIAFDGRSPVAGTVCWVRDGKIGIGFTAPPE